MGQESSMLVDESTPPRSLADRTVESVASYIKEGRAKRIVLMTGAGISTAAGIPDFRSPGTGLYANLAKLDLPYPEAVFDISFFRSNPLPFYTLAHELHPSRFKPTVSHHFIRLLADKGLLLKLFTQNIDCLERAAGVPCDKIIEAHGSFARQRCIDCKGEYPSDLMKQAISKREVPRCTRTECNGLVKPDIVFFGEALPNIFHQNRMLPSSADLAIIMGTSLAVQPFASLPVYCPEGVPRLLLNLERVGGLGSRPDDVLLLGDCDEGVRTLARALGWLEELEALAKGQSSKQDDDGKSDNSRLLLDSTLDDEIAKITEEVDDSLHISSEFQSSIQSDLSSIRFAPTKSGSSSTAKSLQNQLSVDRLANHAEQPDKANRQSSQETTLKTPDEHSECDK
ncbi:MAG: hypothetical protein Q9222_000152 [Ikaeria aurantiellina]